MSSEEDKPTPKRAKAKAKAAPMSRARPKSKAVADINDPERVVRLMHEIDVETEFGRKLCKKEALESSSAMC